MSDFGQIVGHTNRALTLSLESYQGLPSVDFLKAMRSYIIVKSGQFWVNDPFIMMCVCVGQCATV